MRAAWLATLALVLGGITLAAAQVATQPAPTRTQPQSPARTTTPTAASTPTPPHIAVPPAILFQPDRRVATRRATVTAQPQLPCVPSPSKPCHPLSSFLQHNELILVGGGAIPVPGSLGESNGAIHVEMTHGTSTPGSAGSADAAGFLPPLLDTPAPDNRLLLVVAVTFTAREGDQRLCTGTLLDPTHVLTAGHCGCGLPGTYQVYLDDDVHHARNPPIAAAAAVVFDPRVCRDVGFAGVDLALVVLPPRAFKCPLALATREDGPQLPDCRSATAQRDVTKPYATFGYADSFFMNDVRPKLARGQKLTVVGYGFTQAFTNGNRMSGGIPVASLDCTERGLQSVCAPFAEMVLADRPGGPAVGDDTCAGDSGGPVFLNQDGFDQVIAVTSRGLPGVRQDPVLHCGGGGIYEIVGRHTVQNWFQANGIWAMQIKTPPPAAAPTQH